MLPQQIARLTTYSPSKHVKPAQSSPRSSEIRTQCSVLVLWEYRRGVRCVAWACLLALPVVLHYTPTYKRLRYGTEFGVYNRGEAAISTPSPGFRSPDKESGTIGPRKHVVIKSAHIAPHGAR